MRYSHRSKQGIFSRFIRGLAGLIALLSKDSLASGDKGYECRIIGRGVDRKTRKFGRTLLRCSVPLKLDQEHVATN